MRGKRIFKPDEGVVVVSFAVDIGAVLCVEAGVACLACFAVAAFFGVDTFVAVSGGETADLYRRDGCSDVGAGTLRIGERVCAFPLD